MGYLRVLLTLHRYLRVAPVCSRVNDADVSVLSAPPCSPSPSPSVLSLSPSSTTPPRPPLYLAPNAAAPRPAPHATCVGYSSCVTSTAATCAAWSAQLRRRRATALSTWDAVGAGGGGQGGGVDDGAEDGCSGEGRVPVRDGTSEAACGAAEVVEQIETRRRRRGRWQRPSTKVSHAPQGLFSPACRRSAAAVYMQMHFSDATLRSARRACYTSGGTSTRMLHDAASAVPARTTEASRLDELLRRVEAPAKPRAEEHVTTAPWPSHDPRAATSTTQDTDAEAQSSLLGREGGMGSPRPLVRVAALSQETPPYVPLLFRPDFQRDNPHARRHAAAAATTMLAAQARRQAAAAREKNQDAHVDTPGDRRTSSTSPPAVDGFAFSPGREPPVMEKHQHGGSSLRHSVHAAAAMDSALQLDAFELDEVPTVVAPAAEGQEETPLAVVVARGGDEGVVTCAEMGRVADGQLPLKVKVVEAGMEDGDDGAGDAALDSHAASLRDSNSSSSRSRRTHRLILDPVEWLAQAADAPLMDTELLETNTHVRDGIAEALTPSAAAAYTEWRRTQEAAFDVGGGSRLAAPADADVTGLGYDAGTAALMATASPRRVDGDESGRSTDDGEGDDTRLQEALEAELYADVSRAVRKQQWHRASTTAKAKRGRPLKGLIGVAHDGAATEVAPAPAGPHELEHTPSLVARVKSSVDVEVSDSDVSPGVAAVDETTASTSAAAVECEALVYNIFTRRVAKAGSSSIRTLALMGIGVDPATRELAVTDASALRELSGELRAHRVSWPQLWSRGALYRQLERLLSDAAVGDPVARVAGLLKLQYNKSHLQHQKPGLVVGDSGGAASSDTNSKGRSSSSSAVAVATTRRSAMAESIDDKLLTLQDLNPEQQAVVELVMKGHNTYIGGGAGTGKSVLLRVIKQQLVREGLAVAVTGTTGIAGSQLGGCTLHHCLGINLLGEFTRRKDLSSYDVIIIDEVSMLSRELFESLEVHLRRANNINLPFGGVQMILSGDFLQLGAIDAQPLITSNTFRRNFVQLKLQTVVRQNRDLRFAAQLQQLRRGRVPLDLRDSVRFMSREEVVAEQRASAELRARQQAQLEQVLLTATPSTAAKSGAGGDEGCSGAGCEAAGTADAPQDAAHRVAGDASKGEEKEEEVRGSVADTAAVPIMQSSNDPNSSRAHSDSGDAAVFVDGAVNLLPTNREVDATNVQQLARLSGELMTYTAQLLPPSLVGSWSPTYVLRIVEPGRLNLPKLALEITRHLAAFYTHGQRASTSSNAAAHATPPPPPPPAASGLSLAGDDLNLGAASGFSDGTWLTHPSSCDRSIVLYPLFVDALALRVRLPVTMDREEGRQFLAYLSKLDAHLQSLRCGVSVRDVLAHADGMHTERDEYTLSQYAERAPLARPLGLKIGARVMLRTNLAPGLVNGSLGTVVAFRRLEVDQLPRYIVGNAQREASIQQYSDFLQYEQGFEVPVVPVVDFNGRQEVIPPVTQYVGGLPNTHHYSMGIVALPLSLAYAFTVHKVQGLTLVGRVHLELSRMWPCEHLLYVAMSRVRNPEQLSVSSFHPDLVRTAADSLLFDDSLPPVAQARIAPYMLAATWRRSPGRRKKVLLKKRLEAYVKQRQKKLQREASKGDILAEVRLLEEKILKQRARATAAAASAAVPRQSQVTEKRFME